VVTIPASVRAELVAHAHDEDPNEACGLIVLRDGVAERYERGRNAAESPYRFELELAPELWFLEDDGYELAVFHSHLSSPPRPSRTVPLLSTTNTCGVTRAPYARATMLSPSLRYGNE